MKYVYKIFGGLFLLSSVVVLILQIVTSYKTLVIYKLPMTIDVYVMYAVLIFQMFFGIKVIKQSQWALVISLILCIIWAFGLVVIHGR